MRLLDAVTALSKAFALAVPHSEAIRVRDTVGFFQALKAVPAKSTVGTPRSGAGMGHAVHLLASKALSTDGVVDIF